MSYAMPSEVRGKLFHPVLDGSAVSSAVWRRRARRWQADARLPSNACNVLALGPELDAGDVLDANHLSGRQHLMTTFPTVRLFEAAQGCHGDLVAGCRHGWLAYLAKGTWDVLFAQGVGDRRRPSCCAWPRRSDRPRCACCNRRCPNRNHLTDAGAGRASSHRTWIKGSC